MHLFDNSNEPYFQKIGNLDVVKSKKLAKKYEN
jgi:hypothetical protein